MTDEARDWEQLRSDAIREARKVTGDVQLAEAVTDAILSVVDEETVRRLCDDHIKRTNLRSMSFRNGATLAIEPAREMAAYWVGAARALLEGAENYTETRVDFGIPEDPQRYSFVVQKAGKLTPHEARRRAEAECAELRTEVEQLRATLQTRRPAVMTDTERQSRYILETDPHKVKGRRMRDVLVYDVNGHRSLAVEVPDAVAMDVLDALRKAYQQGREDNRERITPEGSPE